MNLDTHGSYEIKMCLTYGFTLNLQMVRSTGCYGDNSDGQLHLPVLCTQ